MITTASHIANGSLPFILYSFGMFFFSTISFDLTKPLTSLYSRQSVSFNSCFRALMNGFQHKQLYFLSKLNESLSQWRSTNKPETNNHNRYIFVNFEIIQNIRLHKHTIDIQLDCVHVNAKLTTYHSQKIYNIYPIAGDERKIKRGKNYNNFDLLFVNNNLQCVS